jgi:hypothetical protein
MLPERHYTVRELSELNTLNYHTLLRRLKREDGVLHIGNGPNDVIRVPESIWLRVYAKWQIRGRK